MKTENQNRKNIFKILIAVVFLLLFIQACMETISPSNENEHELTVLVYQTTAGANTGTTPIRNAEVNVFAGEQTTPNALKAFTNSQGATVFRLKVPLTGSNYNITATYNNRTQSKNSILLCRDTTLIFVFDTTQVTSLDCANLNREETLVFVDDNFNPELNLNTPANISRYDRCTGGLYNAGTENITLTLPKVNPPFKLQSVLIDGSAYAVKNNQVIIKPGETLTLCFSVSTKEIGEFAQTLSIPLVCENGDQGTYSLTLIATVVPPTCDCDEYGNNYELKLSEKVPVGEQRDVKKVVFTNNSPCNVIINQTAFDGNDGWAILSPNFPITIKSGASLELTVRFNSISSGTHIDTLSLEVTPEGTENICQFDVYLEGEGCSGSCPLISTNEYNFQPYQSTAINDTISNRTDKRVFFSMLNVNPPIQTTVSRLYYFMNPDSACNDVNLDISVSFQNGDIYSKDYFTVSPTSLTLAPGEIGVVQVTFSSPDIEEFADIVNARGNTGMTADSAFNIILNIKSPGCEQKINATTVVTVFPDISPIINLRAYSQRTQLAPEPENEVYYFGRAARTIIKAPGNRPGPYPPPVGDIWIDVNDTLPSANPPQEPILKSVDGMLGMKIWRTNMLESDFTNVGNTYIAFANDPNYSTGYTPGPITGLSPGNVIAFQMSQNMYALIYIRSIYNGTENNTNMQSGIEFRSIYPIYIP